MDNPGQQLLGASSERLLADTWVVQPVDGGR